MKEISQALHVVEKIRHDLDFEMFKEAYEEVRGHTLEDDYLMERFSCWQNNTIRWAIQAKSELTSLLEAFVQRMPIRIAEE